MNSALVNDPGVTVVIPTYDRSRLLRATLDSVLSSDFPLECLQVIVVDDGSHDDTFDQVRSTITPADLIYVHQADRGFRVAAARNLGLRLARAPLVVFLDCGVAIDPRCIRAHVDALGSGTTVSFGHVIGFDDSENPELLDLASSTDLTAAMDDLLASGVFPDIRERVYALCDDDLSELPAPWAIAWTCNLAVRRDGPAREIFFDESFEGWGGEDIDFALRLHRAGARFDLTRSARSIHLPHPKPASENKRSSAINKRYLHEKHGTSQTELLQSTVAVELNERLLSRATDT